MHPAGVRWNLTANTTGSCEVQVGPYIEALQRRGWKLSHIVNTHHHHDHAGGNLELKKLTGCKVFGLASFVFSL
jgi:glyoxylase-like metal-dependent hydrolase (beta-lactamase superfamily II)